MAPTVIIVATPFIIRARFLFPCEMKVNPREAMIYGYFRNVEEVGAQKSQPNGVLTTDTDIEIRSRTVRR